VSGNLKIKSAMACGEGFVCSNIKVLLFSRTCLINGRGRKKSISSGAKAHFFLSFYVGAKAPTPLTAIHEIASGLVKRVAQLIQTVETKDLLVTIAP
jgi:hypothetical protein